MTNRAHPALLACCLGLITALTASAQQESDVAPSRGAVATALGQAHGLALDQGVLRAVGPGYKAIFDGGGMELTPALGSRAERNLPLRFTLESIRCGSVIVHEVGVHPRPERDGNTVVYRRGADIRERYEVRAEGVEQSFTFARPLPGDGDLVVRGRITTELEPVPATDGGGGLLFLRQGLGGVVIGAVTGIDAAGTRRVGALRVEGDCLELSLPADFVRGAAYPLVLDPLVGGQFAVGSGTDDDSDPDAAYDQTHGVYLVAWRRVYSATDSVILAQQVNEVGALVGAPLFATSSGYNARPTVANVNARDRFLVVWQAASSVFGPFDIQCRSFEAGTGGTGNIVTIAGTTTSETWPDAAGDNMTGDTVLVVWEDAAGRILGQPVSLAGVPPAPVGQPMVLASSMAFQPAISRGHDFGTPHLVVWTEGGFIAAQAVDQTMAPLGSTQRWEHPSAGVRNSLHHPDVDGSGTDFLVVYASSEIPISLEDDIRCQLLRWNGSDLVLAGPAGYVEAEYQDDETDPTVAWLGSKYLVLWSDEAGLLDYQIQGAELDGSCRPCGARFTLTGLNNPATRGYESAPRVATQRSGGATNSDLALIVFGEAESLPPFTSGVVAQRHRALGGGPFVDLSPGCGNGGSAHSNAPFAVGSSAFRFVMVNAVPGSLAFLSLSLGDPPLVCGSCTIAHPPTFQFKGVVPGDGTMVSLFPVPCQFLPYVGTAIEFQWATLVSGASPCPLAPDLSTTNRRRITLGY